MESHDYDPGNPPLASLPLSEDIAPVPCLGRPPRDIEPTPCQGRPPFARDLDCDMDSVDSHLSSAATLRHVRLNKTPPESPEKKVPPSWSVTVVDTVRPREPRWGTTNIVVGGRGVLHSVLTGEMVSRKLKGLSDGAPTRIKLVCATLKVHNPDAIVAIRMAVYDPETRSMVKKEFTKDSAGLRVSYTWGDTMPANGIPFSALRDICNYWIEALPLGEAPDTESLFTLAIQWK